MKRHVSFFFALVLTLSLMSSLITLNAGAAAPAPQEAQQTKTAKADAGSPPGDAADAAAQTVLKNRKNELKKKPKRPDPRVEYDADVPASMNGKVNRKEYLNARAGHTALLRGYADYKDSKENPRVKALSVLDEQKARLAKEVRAGRVRPDISNTSWTPLGPAPLPNGQTAEIINPVNGRTTAVAIHPTNLDIAYVGTAQAGLYRTLDGGQTWTPLMDSAQTLAIGAVTIDPGNPSTVWVGTGESNLSLDSFQGVGVYRVVNADSATPTLEGPFQTPNNIGGGNAFRGTSISSIVFDPTNNNNMFVGTTIGGSGKNSESSCCGSATLGGGSGFLGLWFSTNAQSATPTWAFVTGLPGGGVAGIADIFMDPTVPNTLVVYQFDFGAGPAFQDGIWRSTNAITGGATSTWTRTLNIFPDDMRFDGYKEAAAANAVIYAATGENSGDLRRSTDGGATWSANLAGSANFCGGQCFYDIAIAVDKGPTAAVTDDTLYFGGDGTNIFRKSTDGGATSATAQRGLHADTHAIEIAPSNANVIYTGNDGGIWRSNDRAVNWLSLNNTGFDALQFQSLAVHPTDRFFSIGGTQDNGTQFLKPNPNSQLPFNGWQRADFGDGGFARIDQTATDTSNVVMYHTYFNATGSIIGFARVSNSVCAREENVDTGWAFKGFGATPGFVNECGDAEGPNGILGTDQVLFYAPLELGPPVTGSQGQTVYFGTDKLYRSINKGDTMTPVSQDFGNTNATRVSSIAISPQDDNYRLVGLVNGGLFFSNTAAAVTMTSIDPSVAAGSVVPNKFIGKITFDPANKNTAYIALNGFTGAQNHVYRVTNLDTTPVFTNVSGTGATGIPDVPVNAFVVDPTNSNTLYAGTDIGVYISLDAGATWNPFGTGLPRVAIFDMAIQNTHRILRVATHGRGLWEIALSPSVTISGQITGANNSGVTVRLTGSSPAPQTTTTDAGGNYSFPGLSVGGHYTVMPVASATQSFAPASRTYTDIPNSRADANFVSNPPATPFPVASRQVLISEFRLHGPGGAADEFIELYNNSDSAITVSPTDGSEGWAIDAADATSARFTAAVVPTGTVIPARAHYLLAARGYSLLKRATADQYYTPSGALSDIPENTGIALYATANRTNFAAGNRLDAVGFTGAPVEDREGTGLSPVETSANVDQTFVRIISGTGAPKDTDVNTADFLTLSPTGQIGSTLARLGAPGPENLNSAIARGSTVTSSPVDTGVGAGAAPNFVRNGSETGVNRQFGTLTLRRRFTNNTGQVIRRMQFRIIDITTLNNGEPAGTADLRFLDSTALAVSSTAGTLNIRGTLLNTPPVQPLGGGFNSVADVILPTTGLDSTVAGLCAPGSTCSVDVQFKLGVMTNGTFRFYVLPEVLQ